MAWYCCCGCPGFCFEHGETHSPCSVTETLLFYTWSIVSPEVYIPTDPDCPNYNISFVKIMERSPTECKWSESLGGESWTLEILSSTSAELVWTDGTYTLVYVPAEDIASEDTQCAAFLRGRTYDPLCNHVFELDENHEDHNPNPDCEVPPRCICVTGENNCCDNQDLRSEALPDTLYGTVTYCYGATGESEIDVTLTWNPATSYWEGSVTIGNGDLDLRLECTGGIASGCGEAPPNHAYNLDSKHTGCGNNSWKSETPFGSPYCACNPFEVSYQLADHGENCCAAEVAIGWTIIITE